MEDNIFRPKKPKTNYWRIATVILVVLLVFSIYRGDWSTGSIVRIDAEDAGKTTSEFINGNLLPDGVSATVKEVTEESGMYKLNLDIRGEEIPLYMSPDGKLLFVQFFDTTEEIPTGGDDTQQAPTQNVPKTDKPVVDLFVMSHCPYGTQIEKGIIPVVKELGDNIEFNLRFVNYAMHGEVEVKEQLNQYCIQKEEPEKLIDYLECFLAEGDGEACLADIGIDADKLASCVAETDEEFTITELLEDESTWSGGRFPQFLVNNNLCTKYGVQGSPTLVINGVQVSSGRDSVSLMNSICAAFNDAPDACNAELSSASPSPDFGWDVTGAATAGSCS